MNDQLHIVETKCSGFGSELSVLGMSCMIRFKM